MLNAEATQAVNEYCERLQRALRGVPAGDADDIVAELRGHLLERIEALPEATDEGVQAILRAVGDPSELASGYRTECALRGAASSRSPLVVLKATLRWAPTGAAGVVAFVVALLAYGCATTFYVC